MELITFKKPNIAYEPSSENCEQPPEFSLLFVNEATDFFRSYLSTMIS